MKVKNKKIGLTLIIIGVVLLILSLFILNFNKSGIYIKYYKPNVNDVQTLL